MGQSRTQRFNSTTRGACALACLCLALGCTHSNGGGPAQNQVYAPSVDPSAEPVDGLVVGHRLMAAGQYELALDAFIRAAGTHGLTADVLSALGSANLGLGRLNQAENLLREATEQEPMWPELWNNLGVVLMERGKTAEAEQVFRRAFAMDDGESDSIRDNLRLVLQKLDEPSYDATAEQNYKLVRRGSSDFLIRRSGT